MGCGGSEGSVDLAVIGGGGRVDCVVIDVVAEEGGDGRLCKGDGVTEDVDSRRAEVQFC